VRVGRADERHSLEPASTWPILKPNLPLTLSTDSNAEVVRRVQEDLLAIQLELRGCALDTAFSLKGIPKRDGAYHVPSFGLSQNSYTRGRYTRLHIIIEIGVRRQGVADGNNHSTSIAQGRKLN
jgi:hypothetical protein